jgi:hypothetical protein
MVASPSQAIAHRIPNARKATLVPRIKSSVEHTRHILRIRIRHTRRFLENCNRNRNRSRNRSRSHSRTTDPNHNHSPNHNHNRNHSRSHSRTTDPNHNHSPNHNHNRNHSRSHSRTTDPNHNHNRNLNLSLSLKNIGQTNLNLSNLRIISDLSPSPQNCLHHQRKTDKLIKVLRRVPPISPLNLRNESASSRMLRELRER